MRLVMAPGYSSHLCADHLFNYVNSMVPQLQLLQPICYEGAREQYRYKLDKRDWEDFLLAHVRCFELGLRRDFPHTPYEDFFTVFPFVYMTLPVDESWNKYLRGKDFAQLQRLGNMDASVDTSAYQWAVRLHLAVAYRPTRNFRDYLDTFDGRKAMMQACVNRIHTHDLKCATADNTHRCDPDDVKN